MINMNKRYHLIVLVLFVTVAANSQTIAQGMVLVESGQYSYSDDNGELDTTSVTVSDFYISKHEVTVSEWKAYLHDIGDYFDPDMQTVGEDTSQNPPIVNDAHPVVSISWVDALRYCNWLSEQQGLSPVYSIPADCDDFSKTLLIEWNRNADGYRLPTEAEWTFAAIGGLESSGFEYSGSNQLSDVAWWSRNSGGRVQMVMAKEPNELGLFDMTGNADEMCWDLFHSRQLPAGLDFSGPDVGSYPEFGYPIGDEKLSMFRTVKGGSVDFSQEYLSVWSRGGNFPIGFGRDRIGFRVARNSDQ